MAKKIIPQNINVVLNSNDQEHVDIMFYSKRLEAYHSDITEVEFNEVTKSGMPIAAFESTERNPLPAYVLAYKNLFIIPVTLK